MKYIIGDIHANINELKKLLKLINPTKADQLIFLGDYIDKHIHAQATIALLEQLDSRHDCVFIKGNHDYVWERYLYYRELPRQDFLINFGGIATLSQLCKNPVELLSYNKIDQIKILLKSYTKLIPRLVDYIIIDQFIVLHAGITAYQLMQKPLKFTELNYFLRPSQMNLTKKYLNKYRLVAGHTYLDTKPLIKPGYINLDLGAGNQGFLGALCVEDHRVVRSDGTIYRL